MNLLAIIPARSGSKGVPDKNIKLLNGKPLIAHSIEAAIKSGCFSEVYVSTDSEKYASIAREYGASVPFLRCAENAGDKSSSWDAVKECINGYKKLGKEFDGFMLLQPTSPLRTAEDIQNAVEMMKQKNADTIVSIVECDHSPLYSFVVPSDNNLRDMCNSEYFNLPRQALPTFYRLNGAIYLSATENFIKNETVYCGKVYGYEMSQDKSVDIDTELDFKLAEFYLNR